MRDFSILLITCVLITGCIDKKIEITTEYIVNRNWSKRGEEEGANSIEIRKMKLKEDSTINLFADFNQPEILSKLEYDSSFSYYANVKIKSQESYQNKKIYFNKENDFYWLDDVYGNIKVKTIGKLEKNNWYEISKLKIYSYVLYIDSLDNVHRFTVNLVNY